MRNLKKLLAVIVSLCVLATFAVPAFAADATVAADTQTCADLGVIVGTGSGVNAAYGATAPTRIQAAVMVLTLTGNLDAAKQFTGTENFADASKANWAKPLMAFLKTKPELGFVGDGKNFMPNNKITAQEYYKVLLTALGYSVPADYAYANTLTFAKDTVKLAMVGNVANFTIDSLASATVEALKANVKGGTKTLAATLVDAGKLNKDAAIAAKMYTAAPATVGTVTADNLMQVVVAFTSAVDKTSAEDKSNYSIDNYNFESASLGADGKTVTLTLKESDNKPFENQKEYKITVDGVKDAAGKAIAKADKVAFTPVDTVIPTVKEIVPLGTKALKVVFTEPVKKATAATTGSYKVDGKSIAGSVDYTFPSTVIIKTTLATGEHKLTVDGVYDFNSFKAVAKDLAFTVAEDSTAPEVVSAKATDLTKVEVIFNEPVKAVTKAYHTSSSKTGTIKVEDTKVTVDFSANRMTMNATTVTLENVEDYSGNKATRTVDVTPVLDTERPTVTDVKVEKDGTVHKFTVTFSESVVTADAQNGANYVIKDKDAKVVTGKGLNAKGSPAGGTYDDTKKNVVIKLSGLLDAGTYTIEISGIQDKAYVANTMLPYSESFTIGDTKAPEVSKSWVETTNPVTGKYENAIFVNYSEDVAVDGNGNALDRSKYSYSVSYAGAKTWKPLPTDTTLEMVTSDTLKITFPRNEENLASFTGAHNLGVRVALVSDPAGNFIGGSTLVADKEVTPQATIALNSAKATAKDTIEAEFQGVLTNIDADDFRLVGTTSAALSLDTYSVKDGKTTAVFKIADEGNNLKADAKDTSGASVAFTANSSASAIDTKDAFGAKVTASATKTVTDSIVGENVDYDTVNKIPFHLATSGSAITLKFNEAVTVNAGWNNLVAVKVDGTEAKILNVTATGTTMTITLATSTGGVLVKSDDTNFDAITGNEIFDIQLKDANDTAKRIVDGNGNAIKAFTTSGKYNDVD